MMDRDLRGQDFVRVNSDDLVIFSKSEKEQLDHLRFVQEIIASQNLKVKILEFSLAQ